MPVAARIERDGAIAAVGTAIEMAAQVGRAAPLDGMEHPEMQPGQPGPVLLDEALRELSDDIGHLEGWPGHRGCNLRERFTVSGLDTARVSKGLRTAVKCRCDRWR